MFRHETPTVNRKKNVIHYVTWSLERDRHGQRALGQLHALVDWNMMHCARQYTPNMGM